MSTANNGGISASTLNFPQGIYSDGTNLFVSDASNNRVLIWNSIPTASGTAATGVFGQPDFVASSANSGGYSATSLYAPYGLTGDGTKLFIGDINNYRILVTPMPN
ncbi:MAG: hypothetical protein NT027_10445 [Proteobacteria bacterium]|nr:hypothetical protein [Pseudomonadota bacterium]